MKTDDLEWAGKRAARRTVIGGEGRRYQARIGAVLLFLSLSSVVWGWEEEEKPRQVIQAAIEAMGGQQYLDVRNSHSSGRYFVFEKNSKGFSRFLDWTVYKPIKSRFQLGKDKNSQLSIYNLETRKGWRLEGKSDLEEIPEEEIEHWERSIKDHIDLLLKKRVHEKDIYLYYYSRTDIAGSGDHEAVEVLDASNHSTIVFFDLETHLPSKTESHFTDKLGIRHKRETEFFNWHTIQGIRTPLRVDVHVDGERSNQQFLETVIYNVNIPPEYFLEPETKEKRE